MILNGKAYEDFGDKSRYDYYEFTQLEELFQYTLIIEWFDSVGLYIDVEFFRKNVKDEPQFVSSTTDEWNGLQPLRIQFNSRKEAMKQAIIKARDMYNAKFE
jgi:hypothetical protein